MVSMERVTVSDIMQIQSISPGFRFCPTDVELVSHYLRRKNQGLDLSPHVLADVEITKCEPWDLPGKSILKSDNEWFFFVPVDKRYRNGSQAKRATNVGFWKATGKEREIRSRKNVIGTKRTLVFHIGRAPRGQRTNWIMNEFCQKENKDHYNKNSYVLCRVRNKQDSGNDSDSNDNPGEANKASSSKVHSDGDAEDINGVKDGESFEGMQEHDEGSYIFKEDGDLKELIKGDDDFPKKLFKEDGDLKELIKGDDDFPKKLFKEDIVDGFKEDDCFNEILKDDIVDLDDNPFCKHIMSKPIQPVRSFKLVDGLFYEAAPCRTTESVQSFVPRTRPVPSYIQSSNKFQGDGNIQGTANRRIRFEKSKPRRRLLTKRSSGDSNMVKRWLARVICSPLLCIVCVVMVILLLLFAFVF